MNRINYYFLEKIKDYYGYNDFVTKSALKFMEEKNYIKSVNNKIFPIKMRKTLEVANILIENYKNKFSIAILRDNGLEIIR